jgi:hypothetical protein
MGRENRVVFLAGKSFFLGGGGDTAVLDQRRSAVVIKSRDPKDAQR